jgi:hypothetical protein
MKKRSMIVQEVRGAAERKGSVLLSSIGTFVAKNGRFKPIRMFISMLIVLSIIIIVMKMAMPVWFSDTFMQSVFAFTGMLIGADTWNSSSKRRNLPAPGQKSVDCQEATDGV